MGKYPNSELHNKYSDFHWELSQIDYRFKRLYCADIDRLWIEYDFKRMAVIAVIDIKNSIDFNKEDLGITATEKGIYEWFEINGARVFIVFISENFEKFKIKPFSQNDYFIKYSKIEYGEWLLSLRTNS